MDRIIRPKMAVLPDSAIVAHDFTHLVSGDQPYFLTKPTRTTEPAGTLPAGSKVRLLSRGRGKTCLVTDAADRRIHVAFAALHRLTTAI